MIPQAHLPESRASISGQRVEGSGQHEVFYRLALESCAAHRIGNAGEFFVLPCLYYGLCLRLSDAFYVQESHQQCFMGRVRSRNNAGDNTLLDADVDVGVQNCDFVTSSILLEGLQVVESHRLLVEDFSQVMWYAVTPKANACDSGNMY